MCIDLILRVPFRRRCDAVTRVCMYTIVRIGFVEVKFDQCRQLLIFQKWVDTTMQFIYQNENGAFHKCGKFLQTRIKTVGNTETTFSITSSMNTQIVTT